MKIAMIHGQSHKGSTYTIGRMLAGKLAAEAEITEFFLPRDLPHFCLGCYNCIEDDTKCPFYTQKNPIETAIREASLLIFTTPVYCLAPSAPLKSFFDFTFTSWMTHRPQQYMFSKKAVVISTAAGAGTKQAIKGVKTPLLYMGVPYIKSYGINVQAMNWQGIPVKKITKINRHITKLANKLKTPGKPRVGLKTKFIFGMMRKMHQAGWDASPREREYWGDRGWLGKGRPWKQIG